MIGLKRSAAALLALAHVALALGPQSPLRPATHDAFVENSDSTAKILDESFDTWLHEIVSEWGMKGLSIAVVRQKSGGDWDVETKGYGVMNSAGDPTTKDVSLMALT